MGSAASGPGGLANEDFIEQREQSRWWKRPGRGQNARKTVTFGDASAVRSRPLWSLFALFLLLLLWFVATTPWGFPDDFRAQEEAAAEANEDSLSDADVIAACERSADCDEDSYTLVLGPRTFPSIPDTWTAFNDLRTEGFGNVTLWEHTRTSLWRVVRGMFWGILLGVPIGFAMGLSSRLRGFLDTPVELFRPIPPLALLPLFIIWFGIGDPSAVRLLIFASIWIMIISARSGVRTVSLSKVRAAYSLGASKTQILFRVILPNALPELFTGVRVALGVSWGTLVAAELVGTDTGLGSMVFRARNFFRLDVMVVGIIIIAVLGVLMDVIMRFLEARLIPWRGKG
ncbi:MAG: ABC transporter permease [Acidimicrobiales bacterium]